MVGFEEITFFLTISKILLGLFRDRLRSFLINRGRYSRRDESGLLPNGRQGVYKFGGCPFDGQNKNCTYERS